MSNIDSVLTGMNSIKVEATKNKKLTLSKVAFEIYAAGKIKETLKGFIGRINEKETSEFSITKDEIINWYAEFRKENTDINLPVAIGTDNKINAFEENGILVQTYDVTNGDTLKKPAYELYAKKIEEEIEKLTKSVIDAGKDSIKLNTIFAELENNLEVNIKEFKLEFDSEAVAGYLSNFSQGSLRRNVSMLEYEERKHKIIGTILEGKSPDLEIDPLEIDRVVEDEHGIAKTRSDLDKEVEALNKKWSRLPKEMGEAKKALKVMNERTKAVAQNDDTVNFVLEGADDNASIVSLEDLDLLDVNLDINEPFRRKEEIGDIKSRLKGLSKVTLLQVAKEMSVDLEKYSKIETFKINAQNALGKIKKQLDEAEGNNKVELTTEKQVGYKKEISKLEDKIADLEFKEVDAIIDLLADKLTPEVKGNLSEVKKNWLGKVEKFDDYNFGQLFWLPSDDSDTLEGDKRKNHWDKLTLPQKLQFTLIEEEERLELLDSNKKQLLEGMTNNKYLRQKIDHIPSKFANVATSIKEPIKTFLIESGVIKKDSNESYLNDKNLSSEEIFEARMQKLKLLDVAEGSKEDKEREERKLLKFLTHEEAKKLKIFDNVLRDLFQKEKLEKQKHEKEQKEATEAESSEEAALKEAALKEAALKEAALKEETTKDYKVILTEYLARKQEFEKLGGGTRKVFNDALLGLNLEQEKIKKTRGDYLSYFNKQSDYEQRLANLETIKTEIKSDIKEVGLVQLKDNHLAFAEKLEEAKELEKVIYASNQDKKFWIGKASNPNEGRNFKYVDIKDENFGVIEGYHKMDVNDHTTSANYRYQMEIGEYDDGKRCRIVRRKCNGGLKGSAPQDSEMAIPITDYDGNLLKGQMLPENYQDCLKKLYHPGTNAHFVNAEATELFAFQGLAGGIKVAGKNHLREDELQCQKITSSCCLREKMIFYPKNGKAIGAQISGVVTIEKPILFGERTISFNDVRSDSDLKRMVDALIKDPKQLSAFYGKEVGIIFNNCQITNLEPLKKLFDYAKENTDPKKKITISRVETTGCNYLVNIDGLKCDEEQRKDLKEIKILDCGHVASGQSIADVLSHLRPIGKDFNDIKDLKITLGNLGEKGAKELKSSNHIFSNKVKCNLVDGLGKEAKYQLADRNTSKIEGLGRPKLVDNCGGQKLPNSNKNLSNEKLKQIIKEDIEKCNNFLDKSGLSKNNDKLIQTVAELLSKQSELDKRIQTENTVVESPVGKKLDVELERSSPSSGGR